MNLDIQKLIEAGEKVAYNDQLGFAAQIKFPVQTITAANGDEYDLFVVAVIKEKE